MSNYIPLFYVDDSTSPGSLIPMNRPLLNDLPNVINQLRQNDAYTALCASIRYPDSKVRGANMGPIWG